MRTAALLLTLFVAGCASGGGLRHEHWVVTYYDRNRDGIVDFEFHHVPGQADEAWALSDTKFRGRYDRRLEVWLCFRARAG